MKKLFRNSTHSQSESHDCLIAEIKGKKIKVTYESYNANERCTTEFFDGDKWNHILSMLDMGVQPSRDAYIWNQIKRKDRADELFEKAVTMCNGILPQGGDYQARAYNVNSAIDMLQDVDGETMEEIIRGVGMEDQMLRQLVLKMPLETINELLEERKTLLKTNL